MGLNAFKTLHAHIAASRSERNAPNNAAIVAKTGTWLSPAQQIPTKLSSKQINIMLFLIKMLARIFNKRARLSRTAVQQLYALNFQSGAQWQVNLLPFGSICWADEMPDIRQFIFCSEQDRTNILRMFSIRIKFWDGEALSDEERQLWNAIHSQVPTWPLFRRLTLTGEEKLARKEAEKQVESEFESL